MKPYLRSLIRKASGALESRNLIREALQAKILVALQRSGAMIPLAFQGGTALRFLYSLGRFSEDLDFALEREQESYNFRKVLREVETALTGEGYSVEVRVNDSRVVHAASVRFPGLLFELGVSPHRKESLSIKIEVDSRPPVGATLETTVVRRHEILQLQHYDRASLLAGKLHAILQRPYTKGRDLYDLLWYLSDPSWPPPNLEQLNNALRQTSWEGPPLTRETWRPIVLEQLGKIEWSRAIKDVEPFLEAPSERDHLTLETLSKLLCE